MLERTNTHRILVNPAVSTLIQEVQEACFAKGHHLKLIELPGLLDAFPQFQTDAHNDALKVNPYPPPHKEPGDDDPSFYLHSSGSTGFPKPICHTHRVIRLYMRRRMSLLGFVPAGSH